MCLSLSVMCDVLSDDLGNGLSGGCWPYGSVMVLMLGVVCRCPEMAG